MCGALVVLAGLLIHCKPDRKEGFTVVAANAAIAPACTLRSEAAQRLLARIASIPVGDADADELRLIVSKACCMEADISSPAAGVIRSLPLQFRTTHDMDVASTIVGGCRSSILKDRDIALVLDKFGRRGHELIDRLIESSPEAHTDLDAVLDRLRWAMVSFCKVAPPNMERPSGPRDPGFWEADETSDLIQYQGISALPK